RADEGEVERVEEQDDVLASELLELELDELAALDCGGLEVRGFALDGYGHFHSSLCRSASLRTCLRMCGPGLWSLRPPMARGPREKPCSPRRPSTGSAGDRREDTCPRAAHDCLRLALR